MTNKLIKTFLLIITIFFVLLVYLSFYGIETKKLNNKIKNEISNINNDLDLEIKTVRILLSPFDFKVNMKTLGPNIRINNKQIELENIETKISLLSFIKNQFSINNIKISTKLVKIKDLISLSRSFDNSAELIILDKFTKGGNLMAEINLNFDELGKIKNDYTINGFLRNLKFSLLNIHNLENLDLSFKIQNNRYQMEDIKMSLNKVNFLSEKITLEKIDKEFLVTGKIESDKKELSKSDILNFGIDFVKDLDLEKITFSSKNTFNFKIDKKFRFKDINFISDLNIDKLKYTSESSLEVFFPEFKNEIYLRDHKIKINQNQKQLEISGKGKLFFQDDSDDIEYNIIKKKNIYNFETDFNILKNQFLIDHLKYTKKKNSKAILKIKGSYIKNNQMRFNSISFKEDQNEFLIADLSLNNEFKISKVGSIKFKFLNKDKINNKIELINRNNSYTLKGSSLDASKIIDKIIDTDEKSELSKILNIKSTKINLDIKKVYLDNENFVNKLKGEIDLKNNKIKSLSLDSSFSQNEKFTLTIKDIEGEKVTTLFSSRAKPLVKRYKFIKGFEDGSLDFYSIKKNDLSKSQIKIYDFKLQELPVLTKILTLASMQGIADLLSGQGIRFNDFEMNFNNKGSLMTIEEIYALGPAISILMDGYIEEDQLISLRGTLVPATTINKAIGSIPILGDILVGKKVGEGVFGVSFKIKGPPNKLETSVNPIKTLTPRFITRTLEKIKKN
jgi:hypothetical protein